jgi:phage/plasmid-associated DNA primase/DNA polymerase elongation subunit (family B)|nr:MAG TPA: DNA helicase [Caudoviricetes sp.]
MDFYRICERTTKSGKVEIYPEFLVGRSRDILVQGRDFQAIWNEEKGLWSTDEFDVATLVDQDLFNYQKKHNSQLETVVKTLSNYSTGLWTTFQTWMSRLPDNGQELNSKLIFADTKSRKEDYATARLSYSLESGTPESWDRLIGVLYSEADRQKLEWLIGSIVAGDSKRIQKFAVLYGPPGSGKSTVLNILESLFQGYTTTFDAGALGSRSDQFSTSSLAKSSLVAIDQDGDLSRIESNGLLNSAVAHETILINEKGVKRYPKRVDAILFIGTNKPVKITDSKSGLIRRLIDISPTGDTVDPSEYQTLMTKIRDELGKIANHCLEVYRSLGKHYYDAYTPQNMMLKTNVLYNFVEENYLQFKSENQVTLAMAYKLYKEYCSEGNIPYPKSRYVFREELKDYFDEFHSRMRTGDDRLRNVYTGFRVSLFDPAELEPAPEEPYSLALDCEESLLDEVLAECPAQSASEGGTPQYRWVNVKTKLKDIDTSEVHYVKVPENHIVIDFDIKQEGRKDLNRNLQAASEWPPTYAETSQGGNGVHLHYIYDGDPSELARLYDEDIEIKVFTGDSSLRRKVSHCNNIPVAHISEGLPLKERKVINKTTMANEKKVRELIERNLRKEIHPATKPSIDFIAKILRDAKEQGMVYDVKDLKPRILAFAMTSTHQAEAAIKVVMEMPFTNEDPDEKVVGFPTGELVFFDCEVFPNLFLVNWKVKGNPVVHRMINPTPEEIEALCEMRLVGFNCRKYDNHILYARTLGFNNAKLFELSERIIKNSVTAGFVEAYNLSYADVYDFAATKMSLKKWEIELGLHHQELGLPWDENVPEERWEEVAEYCDNDVIATEEVFDHLHADWQARLMLAKLSGLTPNDTTNKHSQHIIFGKNRNPQNDFVYTDLSQQFPGYQFAYGKSTYRGEEVGEGGYVYAEEGIYVDVALLDIASMHPTSIECLNLFGDRYTKRFSEIKQARVAIKHHDDATARSLLDGALAPFLDEGVDYEALAFALKIVINSVYGLTAAKFSNPFKDPRNVDNIVAKRGALFMVDLKHFVQEQGFDVAHIKTDSIKIPRATPEIIEKVMEFGKKYGYTFEHEATYDRMCLVNKAVYVDYCDGKWGATGAQFQHPYVFKELFSKEGLEIGDVAETKSVTTALYLNNGTEDNPEMEFVGKTGAFVPVNRGGGILLREKDGNYHAATGSTGHRWVQFESFKEAHPDDWKEWVDWSYFEGLADDAKAAIGEYGDFEAFTLGA